MPQEPPGKGFLGWLGRQVVYVKKAIDTDVTPSVYEQRQVEERPHPQDPSITLRRTTIDQAIRKPQDDSKLQ